MNKNAQALRAAKLSGWADASVVDVRALSTSPARRRVSAVAWWLPELLGAAGAAGAVVLLWPWMDAPGLWGRAAVLQVVWLSLAAVGLLGRILVVQLRCAVGNRRIRAEQAARRRRAEDEDQADAEEVAA